MPISNELVGGLLVLALLFAIVAAIWQNFNSPERKKIVDGKSVHEWNQITKITLNEEAGEVYNQLLRTLKKHVYRPASVELVGGHRVEALGCQLSENPKYQAHVCSGRFRFKNQLGIEDETTYEVYFRKYENGEIRLDDVEISGRIVEAIY